MYRRCMKSSEKVRFVRNTFQGALCEKYIPRRTFLTFVLDRFASDARQKDVLHIKMRISKQICRDILELWSKETGNGIQ